MTYEYAGGDVDAGAQRRRLPSCRRPSGDAEEELFLLRCALRCLMEDAESRDWGASGGSQTTWSSTWATSGCCAGRGEGKKVPGPPVRELLIHTDRTYAS